MSREFADGQIVPGTRYRVLGHLGSGGMGSVYLVEHTELGKQFVLKALFRELAGRKDLVARLRQEWRSLARLNHANIVNVTDAGTSESGVPFYVMERVEGETLADLLKREHALGVPRAVGIAAAVLDGLSAAHEIGIVHRDVKPPNIFVVAGGGVRLLDFGVAKLADQSSEVITARGVAIGTPRYMSPEQAKGQPVDARADLYAVGLVLFESISGQGPFDDARDANDLLLSHLSKAVPRLSQFHRGVSPDLDDIVMSLLAKDPAARPASAHDVAVSLRAVLKRAARVPSTSGVTPEAGYQAQTAQAITALPSTRPDGVAGRGPDEPEPPTVQAPLGADGVARRSQPPVGSTTTVIGTPVLAANTTLSASAPTTSGMAWAKDGFQTVAASSDIPLGLNDTLVASAPPSAIHAAPPSHERTLPIDGPVMPPPNEAPTRTSVPAAELVGPALAARSMPDVSPLPRAFVETPPPYMSATPPPSVRSPRSNLLPVALAALAVLILIGGVGAFAALRRASPVATPAAQGVEPSSTTLAAANATAVAPPPAVEAPAAPAEPAPDPAVPAATAPAVPTPAPEAPAKPAPAPAAAAPVAKAAPSAPASAQKAKAAPEKPKEKPTAAKPKPAELPASGL